MNTATDTGPAGLALPLALAAEEAARAALASTPPRRDEVRTGATGRARRAARRRTAAVRG